MWAAIIALLWVKFVGAASVAAPSLTVNFQGQVFDVGAATEHRPNRVKLEDISQTDHDAAVTTICSPLIEEVG